MKGIVEKSPKDVSVLMRPCRSRISGTEKFAFSTPLAERGLPDVDQPAFVAIDERAQQHAPDDAENRGVGADAERQREHYGDGQLP